MTTIGIIVLVVIVVLLYVKYRMAISKPADQRGAIDKIFASFAVRARQQAEEAAEAIRTPEISKTEGIQKCKDAIRTLDDDYRKELTTLIKHRDDLDAKLPELKKKPGIHEGKARTSKRKFEEAKKEWEAAGNTGDCELATQHRLNAILFLDLKRKSLARIEKTEKYIREIRITIEKSRAQYDSKKAQLDDLLQEFEAMHGPISTARFNSSIDLIQSLRRETAEKLRSQNAAVEAGDYINDTVAPSVDASDFEDELASL